MAWSNTHSIDLESGSSQYLSVANGSSYYDSTTATIEFWFKAESVGGDHMAVNTYNPTGSKGFYAFLTNVGGSNKIQVKIGSVLLNSTTVISAGTWYHVAYAFDTSESKLYINGALEATGAAETMVAGETTLNIGARASDNSQTFDGLIDDVRIWTTKRTITQIADNRYSALAGNESGLLSYWKLDNALTDSTAGGKTLTNNNTATFSTDIPFTTQTFSETAGTPAETMTYLKTIPVTISETAGTPTEALKSSYGWGSTSKSSASWTNAPKS